MTIVSAAGYLPIDVVGIGSTPLLLFIVSAGLIVLGSIAAALMLFQFRIALIKSLAVLLVALIGAGVSGYVAYNGYQDAASANLASNIKAKYPSLSLQTPNAALRGYLTSGSSAEVTVKAGDTSYKYGMEVSSSNEPSLIPVGTNGAPNPIQFIKSGGVQ